MEKNNILEKKINSTAVIQKSLSPSNRININLLLCRICFEDESSGELIDPCECSGSLKLVHTKCLEKWLSISNTDRCEICKYIFSIEKRDKPIHESLTLWWKATRVQRWRGIVADLICLIVLTPLCSAASYMCGLGATTYSRMQILEGFGLAILCCMLVATYFLWLFIILRFHYKSWRHWCKLNQDVTLLVKHRDPNQSRNSKIPTKRTRRNQESDYITMSPIFPWFSTYNHRFDAIYDFHMNTSYV